LPDVGGRRSCTRRARRRQPGPPQPRPWLVNQQRRRQSGPQQPWPWLVSEQGRRRGPQPPRSRRGREEERQVPRPGLVRETVRASASVLAGTRSAGAAIVARGPRVRQPTWHTRRPRQKCRAAPRMRVCATRDAFSRLQTAPQSYQRRLAQPPDPPLPGKNWSRRCRSEDVVLGAKPRLGTSALGAAVRFEGGQGARTRVS
jgi:hypothetical protein